MGRKEENNEDGELAVEADKPRLEEPPKYAVILHNDDYTTMEFVIEVLMRFFKKTHEEATKVMFKVHQEGRGVAGQYSREIAEMKVMQVTEYAKVSGYPLRCTAEPM